MVALGKIEIADGSKHGMNLNIYEGHTDSDNADENEIAGFVVSWVCYVICESTFTCKTGLAFAISHHHAQALSVVPP